MSGEGTVKPMNTHSFGILGGDSRFLYLVRYLGEMGYSVRAFVRRSGDAGADGVDPARFCTSLRECAECTDLVLPLPASSDGANLSFPPDGGKIPLNTVFASVKKGTRVFAGCCSRYIADLARDAGAVLYDYYTSEELLYKNALLTAEGALFEISSAVRRPFLGLGVTVFGYGRIASLLTRRLVLLGSRVNVVCRSEKARAAAWADGARAFSFGESAALAPETECAVNTVPACVIGEDFLSAMDFHTPVLELASSSGTDSAAAERYGITVKRAAGLPGKYFPESAAAVIGDAILAVL